MNSFLNPTAAQQKAWQLLGLKRYLRRSDVRALHRQHLSTQIASGSVQENPQNPQNPQNALVQAKEILPQILDNQASAAPMVAPPPAVRETRSAQRQKLGDIDIFTLAQCSLVLKEELAFVLPPLWFDGAWRLFAHVQEAVLLHNALARCDYPQAAAIFATLQDWQSDAAPQGDTLPEIACSNYVLLGDEHLAQQAQTLLKTTGRRITHPALALHAAPSKRRLWLDLLQLRGILS